MEERTETNRRFHLSASPVLEVLKNRLVVEWLTPRRWHRRGVLAGEFRVIEIADPEVIPFPGFDKVPLTYNKLQQVVADPHYSRWQSALSAVKGIYLITDTSNGRNYVGKADGSGGIFARWSAYATDGHGSGGGFLRAASGVNNSRAWRHCRIRFERVFQDPRYEDPPT